MIDVYTQSASVITLIGYKFSVEMSQRGVENMYFDSIYLSRDNDLYRPGKLEDFRETIE